MFMSEKDLGYRRVQFTGRGSYIISLPKEWVRNIGLKRGSEVAFNVQSDSSLILVPRKLKEKSAEDSKVKLKEYYLNVDPKEDPQSLQRMITALYVVGADIIRLHFKSADDNSKYKTGVKNFARDMFLGSEVIDETSDEITLQILIRHTEFSIDKATRRMAILAIAANRDAIAALKNRSSELFQSVVNAYNDVNRLGLYIVRQLKFGIERSLFQDLGFETPKDFLFYRIAVNAIKNIGENALNIASNLATFQKLVEDQILFIKEPMDEETYSQILNFNILAHQLFEDATKIMFSKNYKDAEKVISKRQSFTKLENDLIRLMYSKKLDPNIAAILRLILDSSRRIMDHGQDIAELTLNRTVEEVCAKLAFKR
jgi:phosphate uptake regulator